MDLNNSFSMVHIHCRVRTPTEIVFLHGTSVYKCAALNKFLWESLTMNSAAPKNTGRSVARWFLHCANSFHGCDKNVQLHSNM